MKFVMIILLGFLSIVTTPIFVVSNSFSCKAATVRPVSPRSVIGTVNNEFDVSVEVVDVNNLFGISFELNYNSTYLNAISETQGAFLGSDIIFYPNTGTGKISFGITKKAGQAGSSGTGYVANIRFRVIQAVAQSVKVSFSISAITAMDSNANSISLTPGSTDMSIDPLVTNNLSVSATFWASPAAGGTSTTINVTNSGTGGSISYSITDNADWLTTSAANGTTNGSFTMAATANNTGSTRNATVTITATFPAGVSDSPKTIAVTQPPLNNLILSVSPTNWSAPPAGGTSSAFNVTNSGTDGTISYSIIDNADWLTTSAANGTTNGSFTMTATANNTGSTRNATVTITATSPTGVSDSPKTITVTQPPPGDPVLSVGPTNWSAPFAGGASSTFGVTNSGSGGSISYSITDDADWLTTSAANGTTDGSFTMTASVNNTGSTRNATVTITATSPAGVSGSPKTITITQPSLSNPVLSVSPTNWSAQRLGGTSSTFNVANSGSGGSISYSLTDDAEWLTTSTTNGTTDGIFTMEATVNNTGSIRNATVTITAISPAGVSGSPKTIAITQSGTDTPELSVTPTSWWIPLPGGTSPLFNVKNSGSGGSISYSITDDANWLTTSATNGTTDGSFTMTAEENNTGSYRYASVTITATSPAGVVGSPKKISLTQTYIGNPVLSVKPTVWFAPPAGGNSPTFSVINRGTGGSISYSITDDADWLITSNGNGITEGSFIISATSNTTGSDREATVTITAISPAGVSESPKTISVTQGYMEPILKVVTPIFIPPAGAYPRPTTIHITSATSGATIRYTLNGEDPNSSSTIYNDAKPLTLWGTTTIKARAFKSGLIESDTASGTFAIADTVVTPVFVPLPGTYPQPTTIHVTCATSGATITYTLNGEDPNSASTVYNDAKPLTLWGTTTIKVRAFKSGLFDSDVALGTFTIQEKVVAPVFVPPAGTYPQPTTVHVTCATSGALIRYTLNNENPTSTSTPYTDAKPLTLWGNTTIKVRAFKSGLTDSDVAVGNFTIADKVATPFFVPPVGTYSQPTIIHVTCITSGATIRYTLNGEDPTSTSAIYNDTKPLTLWGNTTIKVRAFKSGFADSDIATGTFAIVDKVVLPVFVPTAGTYPSPTVIHITCSSAGAIIRYTLNGENPTSTSALYDDSKPLTLWGSTFIKARAFKSGSMDSDVASGTFTIVDKVITPVFVPPAGTYPSPATIHIICATAGAIIRYTLNGENPTSTSAVYTDTKPLTLWGSSFIKVRAFKSGLMDSDVAAGTFTIVDKVNTPIFVPPAGTYPSPTTIHVTCGTSSAVIRYTLNGEDPTSTSAPYEDSMPLTLWGSTLIKVRAFKSGFLESDVATACYIITGTSAISKELSMDYILSIKLPAEFAIEQNYPNPFNPRTTLRFYLPETESVTLAVYNLQGQIIRILVQETQNAGTYECCWDGRNDEGQTVATGIYLVRLCNQKQVRTIKIVYQK